MKARRFADAEKSYRAALDISPNDPEACYGLGEAEREQRRWPQAEQSGRVRARFEGSVGGVGGPDG